MKLPLLAAITWFLVSIVLFTLPGSAFPHDNWLNKIWFDKWVHIGIFTLLVSLWCWAIFRLRKGRGSGLKNYFFLVAGLSILYGIAIEFIQKNYIPFRSFDVGDIIADSVGCLVGLGFSLKKFTGRHAGKEA